MLYYVIPFFVLFIPFLHHDVIYFLPFIIDVITQKEDLVLCI